MLRSVVISLVLVLAGCVVPIPYSSSTQAPDLSPFIPPDIRASKEDLLMLMQLSVRTTSNPVYGATVDASFVTGEQLQDFARSIQSRSMSGMVLALPPIGVPVGASWQRLHVVCVVAPTGAYATFELVYDNASHKWRSYVTRLHPARQNAIVEALRSDTDNPFQEIDGPCGVSGSVNWSASLRKRVIEFIAHIPPIDVEQDSRMLSSINPSAGDPAAMLVGVGRWREQQEIMPPIFVAVGGYEELKRLTATLKARESAALFPNHRSLYLSGKRSLETLEIDALCVIGSNGELLYLDDRVDGWVQRDYAAEADWQHEALEVLNEERGASYWRWGCVPPGSSWPEAERARAVAFIRALPTRPTEREPKK